MSGTTTPTMSLDAPRIIRAARFATYPMASAARTTRALVSALIRGSSDRALPTVDTDRPRLAATSFAVVIGVLTIASYPDAGRGPVDCRTTTCVPRVTCWVG